MYGQAKRVIAKLGGAYSAARISGLEVSAIYRWTYPKERGGTEGLIPAASLARVIDAAAKEGIELTSEDLDPRLTADEELFS